MSYSPNHIPLGERVAHVLLSLGLIAWGILCLSYDRFYLPARFYKPSSRALHLSGTPVVLMAIALFFAAGVVLTVVVDHYDKRDNEGNYRLFARCGGVAAWMAALSAILWNTYQRIP